MQISLRDTESHVLEGPFLNRNKPISGRYLSQRKDSEERSALSASLR